MSTLIDDELLNESFLQVYLEVQDGSKETNKIENVRRQPEGPSFKQYAGYAEVDFKAWKSTLFYYYVESPDEPSKKPLCSCCMFFGSARKKLPCKEWVFC